MSLSVSGLQLRQAADEIAQLEGSVWSLPVAAGLLLFSQPETGIHCPTLRDMRMVIFVSCWQHGLYVSCETRSRVCR